MKNLYLLVTLLILALAPAHAKDVKVENLTSDEYQKKFDELVQRGYRPINTWCQPLPTTPDKAQEAGFSAIFRKVKNTPAWQSRHGLTSTAYQEEFDKLVAEGYMPTDLTSGCVNQNVLYCVIFEKLPNAKPWTALHNIFQEEFDEANKDLLAQGFKLKLKASCETAIGTVYAGVWQKE